MKSFDLSRKLREISSTVSRIKQLPNRNDPDSLFHGKELVHHALHARIFPRLETIRMLEKSAKPLSSPRNFVANIPPARLRTGHFDPTQTLNLLYLEPRFRNQ